MSKNALRKDTKIFNVATIEDYMALCANALAQLKSEQDSVLFGYSAIMLINQIPDWFVQKLSEVNREAMGLSGNLSELKEAAKKGCFKIEAIRQLANGFKHLATGSSSEAVKGYGAGPFGVGPYGVPYLLVKIDGDKDREEEWIDCYRLCDEVLNWWQSKLK